MISGQVQLLFPMTDFEGIIFWNTRRRRRRKDHEHDQGFGSAEEVWIWIRIFIFWQSVLLRHLPKNGFKLRLRSFLRQIGKRPEGNVFGFISSERISTFPFVDIKLSPFCHFWIIYPWLWILRTFYNLSHRMEFMTLFLSSANNLISSVW